MELSNQDISTLNDFEGFLSFKPTWALKKFLHLTHKIIAIFSGNQALKTASTSYSYALRILGIHPVPKKNVVYLECEKRAKILSKEIDLEDYLKEHESKDSATFIVKKAPQDMKYMKCPECGSAIIQHQRGSRVFRFCSETLPGQSANVNKDGASAEVKNTQYPEFKKWLPKCFIKKDITFRNPAMTIKDPFGGGDIIVEFTSFNQSVQSGAGVQRMSIWIDEEASLDFIEEQRPRLLAEDGDLIFTLTPANRMSHMYDEVFEKAAIYYRTDTIVEKYGLQQIEETGSPYDIAVLQAATDDNPTLSPDVVEEMFNDIDDPNALAIRRYGIFKQVSGRIFKAFDWSVHVISAKHYFPDGVPEMWRHAQGIDYHEHVNWACGFISMSPTDEAFIWAEFNPSPETMITNDIMQEIAIIGRKYKFDLSLCDPLAGKKQTNTGYTVIEDMNRVSNVYKHDGIGHGAYWRPWDTKSTRGRDEIRKRLKNAALFGKPFNNKTIKGYQPTLWILDTCPLTAKSMKNWRLKEWANNAQLAINDMKEDPQQKWSHFNMVWECIFKDSAFRPKRVGTPMPRKDA
jgi:hypothetical protein